MNSVLLIHQLSTIPWTSILSFLFQLKNRKKHTFSFLLTGTNSRKFVFCSRIWTQSCCQCLCSISSLYESHSFLLSLFDRPWDQVHWQMLSVLEKEYRTYGCDVLPKLVSLMKAPHGLNLGETVSMSVPVNFLTRPQYRDDEAPFGMVWASALSRLIYSLIFELFSNYSRHTTYWIYLVALSLKNE